MENRIDELCLSGCRLLKGRLYFVSHAFCLNSALYKKDTKQEIKRANCATNTKLKKTHCQLGLSLGKCQTIICYMTKPRKGCCFTSDRDLAQEFNEFYSRFDVMNLIMKVNLTQVILILNFLHMITFMIHDYGNTSPRPDGSTAACRSGSAVLIRAIHVFFLFSFSLTHFFN